MKTVIATIALSLVCAVSLAKSLDNTVGSRLPRYIDGSAYEPASNRFASQESRAEVRPEAASFDRLRAGLLDLYGGRN
jgi:hypothetical protein